MSGAGKEENGIVPGFGASGDSKKRFRNCSKPDSLTALFFQSLRKDVVKCVAIELGPIYAIRLTYWSSSEFLSELQSESRDARR